jgi:hypothetical protein
LRNDFLESLHLAGSPNQPAQGFGRASITIKNAFRHWARGKSEKKI